MNAEERLQLLDRIRRFLKQHKNLYDFYEEQYILDSIKHGKYPNDYSREGIREILDIFHLIPDEENIYLAFLGEIKKSHGIERKNVVEVGGGPFINLARRMALEQKKGKITVYDPRIIKPKETGRLILKKENFTEKTKVEQTDLLVGLMPCKGAEALINSAIKNKIDFIVWLCEGGPHGDYFDYYEDEYEWQDSMRIIAERGIEENNMGKLKIKYLRHFSSDYPILYNEREK